MMKLFCMLVVVGLGNSGAWATEYTLKPGESVIIGSDRIACGGNLHNGCYTSNKCLLEDGRTSECSGGSADFVLSPQGYCVTQICHFSHAEALQELDQLTRKGYCR